MPLERIISADSHTIEPHDLWLNAIGKRFEELTPRVIEGYMGQKGLFFFSGKQYARFQEQEEKTLAAGTPRAGFDPAERVAFQKKAGIEAEVLYPTLGLSLMHSSNRAGYKEVVRAAAEVYNDWLAEFISHAPRRLIGAAMIPMDDVAWAVKELDRVAERGFRTAMVHAQPPESSPPYRNRVYDPFWARAQEMNIPITLHIVAGRIPDPMACHTQEEWEEGPNMFLSTWEEIPHVLANDFIFGTILDRFPRLKVVTAELELSWMPHFMRRIDMIQGVYSNRLKLPKLGMKASDYLRQRIWHGLIDEKSGLAALPQVGAGQVVWGSDFPHTISVGLGVREALSELLQGVSAPDQEKLVASNAVQLFGLN